MGCGGSKDGAIDAQGVKIKTHKDPTKRSHKLFKTDINDGEAAMTAHLVHEGTVAQMHEKYDLSKASELGHGACGCVMAVKRKDTGDMFALKTITLDSMGLDNFDELKNEINLQKQLDHPNIVKVLESFVCEKGVETGYVYRILSNHRGSKTLIC